MNRVLVAILFLVLPATCVADKPPGSPPTSSRYRGAGERHWRIGVAVADKAFQPVDLSNSGNLRCTAIGDVLRPQCFRSNPAGLGCRRLENGPLTRACSAAITQGARR